MDRFSPTGKVSKKICLPFQADHVHFSRLDRSDRNGPFHFTPFSIPAGIPRCSVFPCPKWRKTLSHHCNFYGLLTADLSGLLVPSMCSYNRSVAASQAKRLFWLLTALEDDLFPEPIWMFFSSFESGVWTHPANIRGRSAQNKGMVKKCRGRWAGAFRNVVVREHRTYLFQLEQNGVPHP